MEYILNIYSGNNVYINQTREIFQSLHSSRRFLCPLRLSDKPTSGLTIQKLDSGAGQGHDRCGGRLVVLYISGNTNDANADEPT